MEREAFLDAQLWLRKLAADDPLLSLPVRAIGGGTPSPEELAQGSLWSLLTSKEEESSTDAQPGSPPAPVESWCCFQLGERYCFFRADGEDQDPAQLQIELLLAAAGDPCSAGFSDAFGAGQVLLRFERTLVYELDTALIQSIKLPEDREPLGNGGSPTAQERRRRVQPPFGAILCGGVRLRIWMDPEHVRPEVAVQTLKFALLQLDIMLRLRQRKQRKKKTRFMPSSSWKDSFRHNLDVSAPATTCPSTSLSKLSPARFLEKMTYLLSTRGDLEAVKMVIDKIVRARRQRGGYDRGRSQSSSQGEAYTPAVIVIDGKSKREDKQLNCSTAEGALFSDMEIVVLVTEVMHLFGEDHAGVNHLLGFNHADESTRCSLHDRCVKCSGVDGVLTSCTTSKWSAWDDFLEGSHQVLEQSRKRKRIGGHVSDQAQDRAQAAAENFCRAIVETDDYDKWNDRHCHAKTQITAMERTAFRALGLLPSSAEPDSPAFDGEASQQGSQEQRLVMAEQVFAALLHRRRQLVRDELVLELLPQRSGSCSVGPENES